MTKKKTKIEETSKGEKVSTTKKVGEIEEIPQEETNPVELLMGKLSELLTEVNNLKQNVATKEYVNATVVGGIEQFATTLQASNMELPVKSSLPENGKQKTLDSITSLVNGIAAIAKSFQPANDPRLIQLGEAGLEFAAISIRNAMRVQAKALGLPNHMTVVEHGTTS